MAWATANGMAVTGARIQVPRTGFWVADLALDSAEPLTGSVSVDLNGYALKGTVRRSGVTAGACTARVVGGAGGMGKPVNALAYRSQPLRVPLSDVLSAVGESLSPESDASALALQLAFWTRLQGPAFMALAALVQQVIGLSWRVRASGEVWVGMESWPVSALSDFEGLRVDPLTDRAQLFAATPNVEPGQTFQGRRVSYVEHVVTEEKIRTVLWWEASA
jgi:hypothetical protein